MKLMDILVTAIDGESFPLSRYAGQVLLVVNVASKCGFTSQYGALEQLQVQYQSHGFSVLGFPCNQFGDQEPGSESEIKNFCDTSYKITFPLFAKIKVNGPDAHPLYKFLKSSCPGILGTEAIKWNFTKFLINRSGEVVARYSPQTAPETLRGEIEKLR